MKYQSGALLAMGLFGMGLLWAGLSKTGQKPAHLTRLPENEPPVAVAASIPHPASEGNRPKLQAKPIRVDKPYRSASWRALDEDELMSSLNELSADDAGLALQLAREARTRFPNSPRAAERDYLEIRALVNSSKLEDAVTKARAFVAAHPNDPLANDVARHLLTHPMHHPTEIGSY